MKKFFLLKKSSLFFKTGLMVLLLLIIGIGTITVVSIREQTKTIKAELIEKNKHISIHLASSVNSAFWSLNWCFVERQMKEAANSEDVIFLAIIKPNGEVYLMSGDKEYGKTSLAPELIDLGSQIVRDSKTGDNNKLIITPIKIGNEQWSLIMGLSLKQVEDARRAILNTNIWYGSLIFFLGMLISFLFSRRMYRRISKLMGGIEEVAKGNLDYKIGEMGRDELGMLATSFNKMSEDLKKTTTSRDLLVKEITERKQAELKLKQTLADLAHSNAELESFSYSVSHDLRAPLRSMNGFSQALLEDYADKLDAQARDYLKRVRAASQRMAELIDDLLKLSRVTRSQIKRERVDLSALANTIVAELQKRQPKRQVEFIIQEGLVANGDTQLLRLALENLLGNAWKFTGKQPGARIEFGVTQHRGRPAYFVRDDGIGFDMSYAQKLFVPFQRLHSATEFPGTGIGLATIMRIIHRHGGSVWAEGIVKQGATFYFTL